MAWFAYDDAVYFFFFDQFVQAGEVCFIGLTANRFYALGRNQQGVAAGNAYRLGTDVES